MFDKHFLSISDTGEILVAKKYVPERESREAREGLSSEALRKGGLAKADRRSPAWHLAPGTWHLKPFVLASGS
jgi:hypothetical protein